MQGRLLAQSVRSPHKLSLRLLTLTGYLAHEFTCRLSTRNFRRNFEIFLVKNVVMSGGFFAFET